MSECWKYLYSHSNVVKCGESVQKDAEFKVWIKSNQQTKSQKETSSSRHNPTTLAANHERSRKQMAVISECANVRECSYSS